MAVDYSIQDIDPQVLVLQIARDLKNWLNRQDSTPEYPDPELVDLIESLEDAAKVLV